MRIKCIAMLCFAVLLLINTASAQDLAVKPLNQLIDCPTAGGPEARNYNFTLRAFPEEGILLGFRMGLFPRFALGISYGGSQVLGYSKPKWNPAPGVSISYRLIDESTVMPAIAIGFINQGYGKWNKELDRYLYKAKGFYAVTGKYFILKGLGEFGLHGGLNQNALTGDDNRLDFWLASDYHINEQIAFIAEYSAAINDQGLTESLGDGHGYFNAGVRWSFGERLAIDLILRDILVNLNDETRTGQQIGREIRIIYIETL